jgi:hypothetical protein
MGLWNVSKHPKFHTAQQPRRAPLTVYYCLCSWFSHLNLYRENVVFLKASVSKFSMHFGLLSVHAVHNFLYILHCPNTRWLVKITKYRFMKNYKLLSYFITLKSRYFLQSFDFRHLFSHQSSKTNISTNKCETGSTTVTCTLLLRGLNSIRTVTVDRLALLRILQVQGSNLGPETGYRELFRNVI